MINLFFFHWQIQNVQTKRKPWFAYDISSQLPMTWSSLYLAISSLVPSRRLTFHLCMEGKLSAHQTKYLNLWKLTSKFRFNLKLLIPQLLWTPSKAGSNHGVNYNDSLTHDLNDSSLEKLLESLKPMELYIYYIIFLQNTLVLQSLRP